MSEPIRSIRNTLTVPEELVEAVKKGERLEPIAKSRPKRDGAGTHVRRFSKILVAYACVAVLLIGVTLIPNLFPSLPVGTPSDTTSQSVVGSAITTPKATKPPKVTTTIDPALTFPPEPAPESPLTSKAVEDYMDSHVLLKDRIDVDSIYSSAVGYAYDGILPNLFDDVFSKSEWENAEREGRFEEATRKVDYDADGDGDVDDDDVIVELGGMCFIGTRGAIYWSMTEAVVLDGYVVYTGNENKTYRGRNPIPWKLYATNDDSLAAKPDDLSEMRTSASVPQTAAELEEAGWILLDDVYDSNMKDVDGEPFGYTIDEGVRGAYKHYCWYLDYDGDDGSTKEVNGLKLFADEPTVPPLETPMVDDEVEAYMERHTFLNDRIDRGSLYSSAAGYHNFGVLPNLFDDVFSNADWKKAEREGRFEEATRKVDYDADGDGDVDENDVIVELGEMCILGNRSAIYWSMTEAVVLDGYVVYTSNRSSDLPGRQPVSWKLYATNDDSLAAMPDDLDPWRSSLSSTFDSKELSDAGWILLDDVYDSNMPNNVDGVPFGYTIDEAAEGAYKHYCWVLEYDDDGAVVKEVNGLKLFADAAE